MDVDIILQPTGHLFIHQVAIREVCLDPGDVDELRKVLGWKEFTDEAQIKLLREGVRAAEAEAENKIYRACLLRAERLWRERHPGEAVWPDGAMALAAALERLEECERELAAAGGG